MWLTFYIIVLCLRTIKPSDIQSDYDEIKFFDVPTSYTVESTVLLNDIKKRDKEVSYKMRSTLNVSPVWSGTVSEHLLKFELLVPQLLGRGTHVNAEYKSLPSMWDSYSATAFYTHWKHGIINQVYLDPSEPEEVLNYKRSLISMFQFNHGNDLGNETDISGTCEVQYEILSEQVIRKIKRRCSWGPAAGNAVSSRRVARYSLDAARALQELYAEEVHEQAGALADAALKARAWLQLRRAPAPRAPPSPPAPAGLADALQLLPRALAPLPLAMMASAGRADDPPTVSELEALLEESAGVLAGVADGGGAGRAVAAALRLLPALRSAPPAALAALLQARAANGTGGADRLAGLCGALGLAGTEGALGAARDHLRLPEPAEPGLAHRYFEGFALAAEPDEAAVMEVLRLGERAPRADVAESALLAAAAAASRLPAAAAAAVQARLLRALTACWGDACRAARLRALANLRRADAADELLRHAERGAGAVALAALDALAAAPERALFNATRLRRLERTVLAPGPLPRRAAALDLLLRRSARAPAGLAELLGALGQYAPGEHAPSELRRLAWDGLSALAPDHEAVRDFLAMLPQRLRGWHARTAPGASALLVRPAGCGVGWRSALRSTLVMSGGSLLCGGLTLSMLAPDGLVDETLSVCAPLQPLVATELDPARPGKYLLLDTDQILRVEFWSEQGESLAGASGADGEHEPVAGVLAVTVGGVRSRRLGLFANEAEGAAPVLHALRPLPGARVVLPLLGAGPLLLRRRGALALALGERVWTPPAAQGWSARLQLRGAVAVEAEARVAGAWGELHARALLWAEPRLRLSADAGGTPCVRAHVEDWWHGREVTLRSALGAALRRVRRRRAARLPVPGRSLALAGCRVLHEDSST